MVKNIGGKKHWRIRTAKSLAKKTLGSLAKKLWQIELHV